MINVPFSKYTSCGNNFVIIDETVQSVVTEADFIKFAYHASNVNFGVGCDNLLIIQRCNDSVLSLINNKHSYWNAIPDSSEADFIFRMFEPSGEEALCCGNGLMSIASYLSYHYGVTEAKIMTEIPLKKPQAIHIGSESEGRDGWANMGFPRKVPLEIATEHSRESFSESIDVINEISIKFRFNDLNDYMNENHLELTGYLVFTGEPHLVIFPDHSFADKSIADYIFGYKMGNGEKRDYIRLNFGTWLIDRIGNYINKNCKHLFPAGVNVNFARIQSPDVINNRCFERGINRETLACGTGALAVAFVVNQLNDNARRQTRVLPIRCRWHDPEAVISVEETDRGWKLSTFPNRLLNGFYHYDPNKASPQTIMVEQVSTQSQVEPVVS